MEVGEGLFVLITYDINTETAAGRKRLRHVAKQCTNYGHRVQNSVFECIMEPAMAKEVKHKLIKLINKEEDSLRFYYLSDKFKGKIDHIGIKPSVDADAPMIF